MQICKERHQLYNDMTLSRQIYSSRMIKRQPAKCVLIHVSSNIELPYKYLTRA